MTKSELDKLKSKLPGDWAKQGAEQVGKSEDWCRRVMRAEHQDNDLIDFYIELALLKKKEDGNRKKLIKSL